MNRLDSPCTIGDGRTIPHAFCNKDKVLDGSLALLSVDTFLCQLGAACGSVLYGLAGGFDGDV
jgi:hypothetical protein